ncbi:protein GPR108 [Nelusetta ayraudi]|uniref:protein GPR108 n=1 Tax=Nelusetta ayraudi TaxID=303726 RepID=UPI003F6FD3FF
MAVAHRCLAVAGYLLLLLVACEGRKHSLTLNNETRYAVDLNNFGFFADGTLDVNLMSLHLSDESVDFSAYPVGFSLSRSRVNGVLSYTAEETDTCPLVLTQLPNKEPLILFLIDVKSRSVNVKTVGESDNVLISVPKAKEVKGDRKTREAPTNSPGVAEEPAKVAEKQGGEPDEKKKEEETQPADKDKDEKSKSTVSKNMDQNTFLLNKTTTQQLTLALDNRNGSYNFSFHMVVGPKAQGLYSLRFHYCPNRRAPPSSSYSFTVDVMEKNPGGYLSAAEMPLSRLYIGMAGVFLTAALLWVYILMKHRYSVFKIHWLMAALAFTKSTSLVFHSINYHFINTEGHRIEGWAVMYYITHLLKGALLFITLALIGTGWAFVKYILSDKEKKIFVIVIPLQVLANVAYIIIESTEEGSSEYNLWKEILFLVDLICCGAILFPVVWSIRHLQEASNTDGKAAMNLEKLKLFRHYYVMIVCYIYFTRIIAILLRVTMPFQWQWCYELLVEVSTLIFFVLTGYKFRPASNNPYLQLPLDEEDVEMDEVVTESGALEGISKVKKTCNGRDRLRESNL